MDTAEFYIDLTDVLKAYVSSRIPHREPTHVRDRDANASDREGSSMVGKDQEPRGNGR